ncbi:MAG: hypothetical protein ACI4SR_00195 [Faecalibacillus sp.]
MGNPNKCRYIMFLFEIMGLIIVGISAIVYGVETIHLLFLIGVFLILGSFVFGIVTVRCPFCHRQLRFIGIIPDEFCPYCGKRLE